MELTFDMKKKIAVAMEADRKRFGNNAKRHAIYLEINQSIYSRIIGGELDNVLSESGWNKAAILLNMDLEGRVWNTAETETYEKVTHDLKLCQTKRLSLIFCDEKGIGKSHAAKQWAKKNSDVALVDCSNISSKNQLTRAIAKAFGFNHKGNYTAVRENLIDGLLMLKNPLIILDEAGDMPDSCFCEIKSLWNALQDCCGWYMMGANGLAKKVDRKMDAQKVGFEEVYDRFGCKYQSCIRNKAEVEKTMFKREQCRQILAANRPQLTTKAANELLNNCELSPRRLKILLLNN